MSTQTTQKNRRNTGPTVAPATDIAAYDDHYRIRIALPGAQRESMQVESHRGILTVSAEAQLAPEQAQPLLEECARQRWQRSFQLSDDCDTQQISANYDNGILELNIAKSAEKSPKKIAVT